MAFPGAEKLLDFSGPFDVPMLDQIIGAFYTPGADPTMVRARSLSPTRARAPPGDLFAGPSSRRPSMCSTAYSSPPRTCSHVEVCRGEKGEARRRAAEGRL